VISRRSILQGAALALGAPMMNRGRFALFAQSDAEYSTVTIDLVRRSTVIDMLGLLTLDFPKLWSWQTEPGRFQQADFERLRNSGITILHPAVGYTTGDIYAQSLRDITQWNTFIAAHGRQFQRMDGPANLEQVKAEGKIGIVVGQQNSSHFRSVEDVDCFYGLGQRVSQLTYCRNQIGGGSSDARDDGLTAYGARIVQRMNKVGMAVDVSHCGDRTTLDAVEASRKPVLITHSNCRALAPGSRRCKSDAAIKQVAAKGGVMGVTMVRFFVRTAGPATIEDLVDHIDHVAKLVGVEHVGVGTDVDLDGRDIQLRPKKKYDLDGLDYAKKIYDLTESLVRRRYSSRNIELILGRNFQRVLSEIWAV